MNSIKLDRRIFETDIVNNTKLPICYAIMLTEPCGLFKNSENKAKYFYRTSIRFLSERFYEYGIKNITTIDIKNILIELHKLDICRFYDSHFKPFEFNIVNETLSPNHRLFTTEAIHFESVLNNSLLNTDNNTDFKASYFTIKLEDIEKILSYKNDLNSVKVINSINVFLRIVSSIDIKIKYTYISYDNIISSIGVKSLSSMNKYISFLSEIGVLKYTNAGVFIKKNNQGRLKSNNIYTLASNEDCDMILQNAIKDVEQKMFENNWIPYAEYKASKTNKNNKQK